jgi:hypothetical protein
MYRLGPTVGAHVPARTASVFNCWCSSSTVVWRLSTARTRRDDPRAFGVVGGHGVHFATPPCVRDDPGRNNAALQQTLLSDLCAVAVRVCGHNHSTAGAKGWACSRELAALKHIQRRARLLGRGSGPALARRADDYSERSALATPAKWSNPLKGEANTVVMRVREEWTSASTSSTRVMRGRWSTLSAPDRSCCRVSSTVRPHLRCIDINASSFVTCIFPFLKRCAEASVRSAGHWNWARGTRKGSEDPRVREENAAWVHALNATFPSSNCRTSPRTARYFAHEDGEEKRKGKEAHQYTRRILYPKNFPGKGESCPKCESGDRRGRSDQTRKEGTANQAS